MRQETVTLPNGTRKTYKVTGGTYYPRTMNEDTIDALENARHQGHNLIAVVFHSGGDTTVRMCSVGRSMGDVPVALFVPNNYAGGTPVGGAEIADFEIRSY